MKNSTELLIFVELLKQLDMKKPEASSWLAFMEFKISQFFLRSSIDQHKKLMISKYQNTTFIDNSC